MDQTTKKKIETIEALGFKVKERFPDYYLIAKGDKCIRITKEPFEDEPTDSLIRQINNKFK